MPQSVARNWNTNWACTSSHYFENIVLPKYLIHSDYDLPINDKNVSLVGCMQTVYVLLVDPKRFERKNDDIEQNVIHSLGVLDT